MKARRHHNNVGYRQTRGNKTTLQVECMARRLGIPYGNGVRKQMTSSPKADRVYWFTARSMDDAGARITTDKLIYAPSAIEAEKRLVNFLVERGHENIIIKNNTME